MAVGPQAHQQPAEAPEGPGRARAGGEAGPEGRGGAAAVLEGEAGVALGAVEEVLFLFCFCSEEGFGRKRLSKF